MTGNLKLVRSLIDCKSIKKKEIIIDILQLFLLELERHLSCLHQEIVIYLVSVSADKETSDKYGKTALKKTTEKTKDYQLR